MTGGLPPRPGRALQIELVEDLEFEPSDSPLRAAFEDLLADSAKLLQAIDLSDLMTAALPQQRWLIDRLIPRRLVTLLSGHGGLGKSTLALSLCAHVAAGVQWGNFACTQGIGAYVSLEDEGDLVRPRLRRVIHAMGLPADRVLAGVRLYDGTAMVSGLLHGAWREGERVLVESAALDELRELAAGVDFLVLDGVADAFAGNVNDPVEVRGFMRALGNIARACDLALVLVGHVDKAGVRHGTNGQSFIGAAEWHNSARSRLALVEDADKRVALHHEKCNVGPRLPDPIPMGVHDGLLVPTSASAVQAGVHAANAVMAAADADLVLAALQAARAAAVSVSTARTGNYSAKHGLATFLPRELGAGKSERFWRALDLLLADGRAEVESYTTDQRKTRQRIVPAAPVGCAAPVPPYPPCTGAAQVAPVRQSEPEADRHTTGALAQPAPPPAWAIDPRTPPE